MTSKDNQTFAVHLNAEKVGVLRSDSGHVRFAFLEEYISNPDREVLGLQFEQDLLAEHRSNVRLPPWFSNLLPEGHLRRWIAQQRNVKEANELDLAAEVGHDLPGAVLISRDEADVPIESVPKRAVVSREPGNVAENIWKFSLAGVAMKFSMVQKGERFTAPAIGDGGDWIVKLPDTVYPDVPLNEFTMMELARAVGLKVPETKLVPRDCLLDVPDHLWPMKENQAYAIRRFDRIPGGLRVHMEDFAQVRGFYPEAKYDGTFETLAGLVYRGHDTPSLVEFVRRLAFNILIGNGDAHLKNWSLLYENPRVPTLSPAYDLVATSVYSPADKPDNLGLRFGKSRQFDAVSLGTFTRLQRKLNVSGVSLSEEVESLVADVQKRWLGVAELLGAAPHLLAPLKVSIPRQAGLLLRHKVR